jgi:hypothetical protein
MTNTYRALCAELADSVELLLEMRAVDAKPMAITEDRVSRARAALAQPEPALSPAVDRMLDLQDRIQMGSLTLAEALDEIAGPNPPSLKERSLQLLETYNTSGVMLTADQADTIRHALEALPND